MWRCRTNRCRRVGIGTSMISTLRDVRCRTWQSRSRSNKATTSYSGEESFSLDQITYSTTRLKSGLELGTDIYEHGRWRELRKGCLRAQRVLAYDHLNIARTIAVLSLLFAAAPCFAHVPRPRASAFPEGREGTGR